MKTVKKVKLNQEINCSAIIQQLEKFINDETAYIKADLARKGQETDQDVEKYIIKSLKNQINNYFEFLVDNF